MLWWWLACRDEPGPCGRAAWDWGDDADTGSAEASVDLEDTGWMYRIEGIATPGDLDGDGISDVLLGQPHFQARNDDNGQDEGNVAVIVSIRRGVASTPTNVVGEALMQLGRPVPVGDVDGDGLADFSVGTEEMAYIVSGRSAWVGRVVSDADAAAPGNSMGFLGDFDGDGADDWLLADGTTGYVVARPSGTVILPEDAVLSVTAEDGAAEFHAAGDLNGDGRADVIVWNGPSSSIILGQPNPRDGRLAEVEETRIEARSVAPIGDVDGDGRIDLVGAVDGGVAIWLGRDDWPVSLADADTTLAGLTSATSACDVNGDGTDDLLVRGRDRISLMFGRSSWRGVVDDVRFVPSALTDNLSSPMTCRDFDGDGIADVLLGAPQAPVDEAERAGVVGIYLGSTSWERELDISAADVRFNGGEGRYFGKGERMGADDFDGDGCDDLVLQTLGFGYYQNQISFVFGQTH